MAGEITGPREDATAVIVLNGCDVLVKLLLLAFSTLIQSRILYLGNGATHSQHTSVNAIKII